MYNGTNYGQQLHFSNNYLKWLLAILWLCLGGFYFFVCKPHFEESFSQWKLIMGLSESYTKNFHKFNDLFLIQYFFEALYAWNERVPWLPLVLFSLSFASIGIITKFLFTATFVRTQNSLLVFAFVFLVMALLCSNLLYIHHTRTSFLLTLCGWLVLISAESEKIIYKTKLVVTKFFALVIIALGVLFRPEAGIVMSSVIGVSLLFSDRRVLIRSRYVSLAIAGCLGLIIYFGYECLNSDSFYYQLEPDVEYEVVNRRNVIDPPANESVADKYRRMAITQYWMLGDVKLNDAGFVRACLDKPTTLLHRFGFFLFPSKSATNDTAPESGAWIHKVAYAVLLMLILLEAIAVFKTAFRKVPLHFLSVVFWFAVLFWGMAAISRYNRVVEPFLVATIIWSWWFNAAHVPVFKAKLLKGFAAVVVAVLLAFIGLMVHAKNYDVAQQLNHSEEHVDQVVRQVISEHPERDCVVMAYDFVVNQNSALKPFNGFSGKKLLVVEYAQFSANPDFLHASAVVTGCAEGDFNCTMSFIENNKDRMIVIGKEYRLKFYEDYMKFVYATEFNVTSGQKVPLAEDAFFWLP